MVLKPAPSNILELYLGSLEALGFDLKKNDIRFVEDDWENPTLGAWGLGWEVWLNGMEVTQFTYFQQVGGIDCKPITGEITYGLERLAMYLQGVDNVYNLMWTDALSYGDVYHQNEVEQSTYNFEHSDADFLFTAFGAYEKQAKHLMEQQLALPAYEQVLKAAHTFNLLDTTTTALDIDCPSVVVDDVVYNEAAGAVIFTITRSGPLTLPSTVNYATSNGTAIAGVDYTTTTGTITFAANETLS